jgi:hypothetical protein
VLVLTPTLDIRGANTKDRVDEAGQNRTKEGMDGGIATDSLTIHQFKELAKDGLLTDEPLAQKDEGFDASLAPNIPIRRLRMKHG